MFKRVHITEFSCNFLTGITGYLLLAEHIDTRPINAMVLGSIVTIPISIGKFLMVLALFVSVPLNIFPARTVMY